MPHQSAASKYNNILENEDPENDDMCSEDDNGYLSQIDAGNAHPFNMSQNPHELSVTKHKTSIGANTRGKVVNVPKNLNDLAYGET